MGSRAADAPVRSTADAVNNDKRDLPILLMFAGVRKNERRELKTTDGVEGGTRGSEGRDCRVQEKGRKGGQLSDEKGRGAEHEPISRAAGGLVDDSCGRQNWRAEDQPSINQINQRPRIRRCAISSTLSSCEEDAGARRTFYFLSRENTLKPLQLSTLPTSFLSSLSRAG